MDSGDPRDRESLDDFCRGQDQWRMSRLTEQLETTKALAVHWESECENLAIYLREAREENAELIRRLEGI